VYYQKVLCSRYFSRHPLRVIIINIISNRNGGWKCVYYKKLNKLKKHTIPFNTIPKTTCLPSNQLVLTVVMKNCEPLVSLPAFAIDTYPGAMCFNLKFSSGNLSPQILLPIGGKLYCSWTNIVATMNK